MYVRKMKHNDLQIHYRGNPDLRLKCGRHDVHVDAIHLNITKIKSRQLHLLEYALS